MLEPEPPELVPPELEPLEPQLPPAHECVVPEPCDGVALPLGEAPGVGVLLPAARAMGTSHTARARTRTAMRATMYFLCMCDPLGSFQRAQLVPAGNDRDAADDIKLC